jgi:hypothetical protein
MTAYSKFALGRTNSPATFVEDNAITTIVAIFNGGSECETVYLNGLWTHKYAACNIAGTTYIVRRVGGWPSDFLLGVDTTAAGGGASLVGLQVTELSAIPVTGDGEVRACNGYATANDGGGGLFTGTLGTPAVAEDGYIRIDAPGGQWQRIYDGALNVRWFGAVSGDTGNQQPAIQTAVTYAAARGEDVFIPAGTYRTTSAIAVPSGVRVHGAGRTTIYAPSNRATTIHATTGHAFTLDNAKDSSVEDLAIICEAGVGGIRAEATGGLVGTHGLQFRRLFLVLPGTGTTIGIELYGNDVINSAQNFFPLLEDVEIFGSNPSAGAFNLTSTGIKIHGNGYNCCVGARIYNGRIYNLHTGIDLANCDTLLIDGTKVDGNMQTYVDGGDVTHSGRGVIFRATANSCTLRSIRPESNDIDIQIVSGAFNISVESETPIPAGRILNGGTRTRLSFPGSAITNRAPSPTFFENRIIAGRTMELMALENSTLSNGLNLSVADASGIVTSLMIITGPTGAFSIGSIKVPVDSDTTMRRSGTLAKLHNSTAHVMTLVHEEATAVAAERIWSRTGANVDVPAGGTVNLFYRQTFNGTWTARWVLEAT